VGLNIRFARPGSAIGPGIRLAQGGAFVALGVTLAAAREAAAPFLLLTKLAAAALVGLGLAGGHRIDAGADHFHRKSDDIDRGARKTAREKQRNDGKKGAHVPDSSAGVLIEDEWREGPSFTVESLDCGPLMCVISVMTEITHKSEKLAPAAERFVLHWGDMCGQWGVNRSVAQIHALLYLSEHPLTAEEIADTLGIARSNVSNSLKELLGWKLIRRVPRMGDRRDHYAAETDLWEMVTRIAQGRKEREIDPAAAALRACLAEAKGDPGINPVALQRLTEMSAFMETINRWYDQMLGVPAPKIMALIRMGSRVVNLLTLGRRGEQRRE
jgi:DNA-binding transcriptional regulator GbsR (MarR family)